MCMCEKCVCVCMYNYVYDCILNLKIMKNVVCLPTNKNVVNFKTYLFCLFSAGSSCQKHCLPPYLMSSDLHTALAILFSQTWWQIHTQHRLKGENSISTFLSLREDKVSEWCVEVRVVWMGRWDTAVGPKETHPGSHLSPSPLKIHWSISRCQHDAALNAHKGVRCSNGSIHCDNDVVHRETVLFLRGTSLLTLGLGEACLVKLSSWGVIKWPTLFSAFFHISHW